MNSLDQITHTTLSSKPNGLTLFSDKYFIGM